MAKINVKLFDAKGELSQVEQAARRTNATIDAVAKNIKNTAAAAGKVTEDGLKKMRMLDAERAKYEGGSKWRSAASGQTTNSSSGGIAIFNSSSLGSVESRLRQIISQVNNPILGALLGKPVSGSEIATSFAGVFRSIGGGLASIQSSSYSKFAEFKDKLTKDIPITVDTYSLGETLFPEAKVRFTKGYKDAIWSQSHTRGFGEGFLDFGKGGFWRKNTMTGQGGYQGVLGNAPAATVGFAQLIGNMVELNEAYRSRQRSKGDVYDSISNGSGMTYEQRRALLKEIGGETSNGGSGDNEWNLGHVFGKWAKERIASGNANIDLANNLGRDTFEKRKIFLEIMQETDSGQWGGFAYSPVRGNDSALFNAKYHRLISKYAAQYQTTENDSRVIEAAQKGVQADMNARELANMKQAAEDKAASGKYNNILQEQPDRTSATQILQDKVENMRKAYFHELGLSYRPLYLKEYFTMTGGTVNGAESQVAPPPTPVTVQHNWFKLMLGF